MRTMFEEQILQAIEKMKIQLNKCEKHGVRVVNVVDGGMIQRGNAVYVDSTLVINEEDFYKYCFIDGLSEDAVKCACNHAKEKLEKKIESIASKYKYGSITTTATLSFKRFFDKTEFIDIRYQRV